jgi:hypothetical protein
LEEEEESEEILMKPNEISIPQYVITTKVKSGRTLDLKHEEQIVKFLSLFHLLSGFKNKKYAF